MWPSHNSHFNLVCWWDFHTDNLKEVLCHSEVAFRDAREDRANVSAVEILVGLACSAECIWCGMSHGAPRHATECDHSLLVCHCASLDPETVLQNRWYSFGASCQCYQIRIDWPGIKDSIFSWLGLIEVYSSGCGWERLHTDSMWLEFQIVWWPEDTNASSLAGLGTKDPSKSLKSFYDWAQRIFLLFLLVEIGWVGHWSQPRSKER